MVKHLQRFGNFISDVRCGAWRAAAVVLAAGLVLSGGCKEDTAAQSQEKLYNADQFQPNDSSRHIWQNVQRQVTTAAREMATLNVADFNDSKQHNENGRR